jgi:hypothetical protein
MLQVQVCSILLYYFARDTTTKYHWLGSINNGNLFSCRLRCWQDLLLLRPCSLAFREMSSSHCILTVMFRAISGKAECFECVGLTKRRHKILKMNTLLYV